MSGALESGGRPLTSGESSKPLASLLEERLWPEGYSRGVWMVVDAARDRGIFGLLLECFYSQHHCLFSGPLSPELELAAPYLVQLDYDDRKTKKFLARAWGAQWGVFLQCGERMETLRRHLRSLLIVRDPKGARLMFRYYDPRVMRVYLPTCTSEELATVFGPIERLLLEEPESGALREFRLNGKILDSRRLPLSAAAGR